jgi:enamine deaminase RidA (YjgF/YER057c/UK114 family)
MFVTDIDAAAGPLGELHGELFGEIRPASTLVEVSRLIDPSLLVEIEVDARRG